MSLSPAESGKLITSKARDVQILGVGVDKCASDIVDKIRKGELELTKMFIKTDVHPQKSDESGINWVFFADTLNFSFWMPENGPQYLVTYKGTTYTGYLAMCAAINRAIDRGIPLTDPKFFANIQRETLHELLLGENDVPIPLLDKRLDCLHEVGGVLLQKFSGSFSSVLRECDNSAENLLKLVLSNFPCFNDVAMFEETMVAFHKRAQILVADIWCLFEGCGEGGFTNIDSLTMFADYRVPQSLQHYGVLLYSKELMDFLKKDEVLDPGHRWELEIRGCSIEAVEQITMKVKELLKHEGIDSIVNSILIDQYLWGYRRQYSEIMKSVPYHKVRSIFY